MSDADIARIGRELAHALMKFARERHDDDRKAVAYHQTHLCAAVRAEAVEQQIAEHVMNEKAPGLSSALDKNDA
jgi:hypothetical protein